MTICCQFCGGSDIITNDARGEKSCTSCGAVVEEGAMVESISFTEGSGMNGQYISFLAGRSGSTQASREQVLARGRSNIQRIGDILRLPYTLQDSAHRIFVLAVQRSFTIGRPGLHVAAACLYAVARRDRTPHLLIDFADVLRTPVKTLGQTFMKLVRTLHLPVPCIDPSLFLERYAAQMELGDKATTVAASGVRIIQALTRDWIATGRRPTGLCGAALLIAARYHGFKINGEDVAHIVRISSHTLQKRLYEFRRTSVAALTGEEFETSDLSQLPILFGPPCLEAAKRRAARLEAALARQDALETEVINEEVPSLENSTAILSSPPKLGKNASAEPLAPSHVAENYEPLAAASTLNASLTIDGLTTEEIYDQEPSSAAIENVAAKMVRAIGAHMLDKAIFDPNPNASSGENGSKTASSKNIQELTTKTEEVVNVESQVGPDASGVDGLKEKQFDLDAIDNTPSTCVTTQGPLASDLFTDDADEDCMDDPLVNFLKEIGSRCGDLATSFPVAQTISDGRSQQTPSGYPSEVDVTTTQRANAFAEMITDDSSSVAVVTNHHSNANDCETLSDVSDAEIDEVLLTEEERRVKELVWDELTKSVMPEVHRRIKSKKRREQQMQQNAHSKRRRISHAPALPEAATPADSVRMAFQQKGAGAAKRINDDLLDSLFSGSASLFA